MTLILAEQRRKEGVVAMSVAWPWHQRPPWGAFGKWIKDGWLAIVKPHHLSTADGDPPQDATAATTNQRADFETFFLRYDRQITTYLWRMTGDEQSASELAQETFLRAWQHFDVIAHYEQPIGWLFRVATNLARQHHRRQVALADRALALTMQHDAVSSDPTRHVAEQDLVRQTLLHLSFHQRAALILREVYGLSCAEVGTLLTMSPGAVKIALWRAREQFRIHYLRETEDAE
jgi:RNA polymerase sigma-70 factor (ECF subfamily)